MDLETNRFMRLLDSSVNLPLGLGLILLTGLVLLVLFAEGARRRWLGRRWRRRQWTRAQGAESEAPQLLAELGFQVLGAQVDGSYTLTVDGAPLKIALRADYLVSREGRLYVAEVKSGQWAPRIGTATTRRQLLEYLMAFHVDGILLVDGEAQRVHEVVFPIETNSEASEESSHGGALVAIITGLAALGYWIFCR